MEPQENPNQPTQPQPQQAATNDDELAALRAELEQSRAAIAEIRTEQAAAISATRDALRAANPAIPAELIDGGTLAEVTGSVEKARATVAAVMAAQAAASANGHAVAPHVPAGGTPAPSGAGMTAFEKIAAGLSHAN